MHPTWLDYADTAGIIAAGLALPLAWIQLAAIRRDRQRGQIDKMGAWTGTPQRVARKPGELWWSTPVSIRNASELPLHVASLYIHAQARAYDIITTEEDGAGVARENRGHRKTIYQEPATIPPGGTWTSQLEIRHDVSEGTPQSPSVRIAEVVAIDAAGRQWRTSPRRPGRAKRGHPRLRGAWDATSLAVAYLATRARRASAR